MPDTPHQSNMLLVFGWPGGTPVTVGGGRVTPHTETTQQWEEIRLSSVSSLARHPPPVPPQKHWVLVGAVEWWWLVEGPKQGSRFGVHGLEGWCCWGEVVERVAEFVNPPSSLPSPISTMAKKRLSWPVCVMITTQWPFLTSQFV